MSEAEVENIKGEAKELILNDMDERKLALKHLHRKMKNGEKLTEPETKFVTLEWLEKQRGEFQDKHGISIQQHIMEKMKTNQELTPTEQKVLKISIMFGKEVEEKGLKNFG